MRRNGNTKYQVVICIFSVVFVFVATFAIYTIRDYLFWRDYNSIPLRLQNIKVAMERNDSIACELYYNDDYEEEFAPYWEYANIEYYYLEGLLTKRGIENGEVELQESLDAYKTKIKEFINTTDNFWMKENAQEYLDQLEDNN